MALFAHASNVVLIVGGTRGVGQATAELLGEEGYRVYAAGRTETEFSHPQVDFCYLDLTDDGSVKAAVKEVVEREGRIDAVINCASHGLIGGIESCTIAEFQEQMDVNFHGAIRVLHNVLPHMRAQHSGRLIHISSTNAIIPAPYGSAYSASKAALESLVECLSLEVAPWNIEVSIVEPGFLQTRFAFQFGSRKVEGKPYERVDTILEKHVHDRTEDPTILSPSQSPEEIALLLQEILESPKLQLRYQTSDAARETVAKKLRDLDGSHFFTDAHTALKSHGI